MADEYNFATPARTRVMVVPLNAADTHFHSYFDKIRNANDIRLLDVAALPDCRQFNPQSFPQGRVLYDFCTFQPDEDNLFLHDFEPFRKTFVVLGLGSYEDFDENAAEILAQEQPTAIVHNCIYFNASSEDIEAQKHSTNSSQSTFFVPSIEDQNITTLETTMCNVTKNYIKALSSYVSSYENITLRSPVSLRDGTALHKTITYAQKKVNSGTSFKVSFAKGQLLPSSTPDTKVKASQRQTGRQAKLIGNFLLLAGQASEASQYFTDAAINLKKADDNLWLGSALEGLAVSSLMLSYLGIPHQLQNPMLASVLHVPKSKLSSINTYQRRISTDSVSSKQSNGVTSPRPSTSSSAGASPLQNSHVELGGMSITEVLRLLCNKAALFFSLSAADFENCVPDLVFIEFLLRSTKLFISIYLAGGDSEVAVLENVINFMPIAASSAKDPVLRADIIALINQIFTMQLIDLDLAKQSKVYCTLAAIYSDLGLRRKRAFILRILLVALLPKLSQRALDPELATSDSLQSTFEYLFGMYNIGRETEKNGNEAMGHYSDWITLQLLLLKICLRISEATKDYEVLAKLCVLILSRYTHCLPSDDQIKLKRKMDWLALLSKESHNSIMIPHPDPFIVRNAKFVLQELQDELVPFQSSTTSTIAHAGDPLIFNPFNKLPKDVPSKDKLISIDEPHQVVILLQNPFAFDLNISNISLVNDEDGTIECIRSLMRIAAVSGFDKNDLTKINGGLLFPPTHMLGNDSQLHETPKNLTIPPNSLCHVVLAFTVTDPGLYRISSIDITFGSSQPQRFAIVDLEKIKAFQRLDCFSTRLDINQSSSILDSCAKNLVTKDIEDRATKRSFSLTAIPPQPTLSLVENLIANGWIMLLEGERREFSIKLSNTSELPINYLSFSFWDSTNDSISAKLTHFSNNNQLLAEDMYELEWQLLKNKPFSVVNKQEISSRYKIIQPQADVEFNYQINGKRGMSELRLILEYSNKSTSSDQRSYIKTLSVPLNVTVQPSLEVIGCDVIPFFSTSLQGFKLPDSSGGKSSFEKNIGDLLKFISKARETDDDEIARYCLLVLDVRNLWKEKLKISFSNEVHPGTTFDVNEIIDSAKTNRILMPIRRISFEDLDVSEPIPSLRKRQFIKNYAITAEEDEQNRKNFWIRKTLLESISGNWHTATSNIYRSGSIDLRTIRLNIRMTNALVFDNILIQHSIMSAEGPPQRIDKKQNEYILKKEHFYKLKTKITNQSKKKIFGVLRHVPFPSTESSRPDISIDQRIFFNGVLQKSVGPNGIASGESIEHDLGFLILEKGRYEWGCFFDNFESPSKKTVGREPVYITVI